MNANDSSKSKSAAIRARLKFPSQQAFIEGYAPNISKTGIFIKTPKPKAVGVRIKFEFQIADGTPVLRGIGEVSWNRAEASKGKPPGMGIKFLKLDAKSRKIVEKIQELKGEEAPAQEAPVEEAPAQEAPVEEAPVEEAPAQEAIEKDEADTTGKVAPKTRTKAPRRRRAAKGAKKKGPAGGIDFGEIDSMLANISSESDGSSKRISGRRARRAAQKELSQQLIQDEVRAEASLVEPRSDSGITAVNGKEPSFEPSIKIQLEEVRELEPETSVELDLDSSIMLKKDSRSGIEAAVEAYTAGDDELPLNIESALGEDPDDEETGQFEISSMEKKVDVQRVSPEEEANEDHLQPVLETDSEEEETEQYDLAFLEKEAATEEEEEVQLIPLDDENEEEEDHSVKVIPIEDEDSEIVNAVSVLSDDDIEETDIEETDIEDLLEEEDEEKTHGVPSDTQVGDFMDDMNDGESVLPPAATESLLQNTEVEEALDDIFQMAGGEDAQPAEETDSEVQEEPVSAETDAETMEAEVTKKVDTKNVDKKKKGFFKKLFG